ncbi:YjgP/YjgQ family permease [Sphingobacteriales bacterium UPWRP_1]|nr:hypothetical protein BVG80_07075 [Sphingobacteriales bacterium TSM_CSM]PSJ72844.1 YjgP/YjgQ family permease [Sphingobacteriales bacterium UPWRP_1]
MLLKIIDRYIITKFLGAFVFTVLLFAAVAVSIDLSERIDDFLEHNAPFWGVITGYYLNFIPFIIFFLSPLFIFIAVIFFTSRLASRSEIIAILASGVSFYRLLFVPYLIASVILVALQLYANHFFVPNANKKRFNFEDMYVKKKTSSSNKNVHMQIAPDTYIYVETFNNRDSTGRNFTLEKIANKQLSYKLSAKNIAWKDSTQSWQLNNYMAHSFNGLKETVRHGDKTDTVFNLKPADFQKKVNLKEAMTTPELAVFIEEEKIKGAPFIEFYQVERYRRTAVPFATFILTIIGFSIASRKVRGGIGLHLFAGIAISSAYVLLLQFATTFATNGNLSPILSVWLPNLLFGVFSIVLLLRAPK